LLKTIFLAIGGKYCSKSIAKSGPEPKILATLQKYVAKLAYWAIHKSTVIFLGQVSVVVHFITLIGGPNPSPAHFIPLGMERRLEVKIKHLDVGKSILMTF
jgi:hypothetical protein